MKSLLTSSCYSEMVVILGLTVLIFKNVFLIAFRFNQQTTPSNSPSKNDLPNYDSAGNLVLEVDTQTDDATSDESTGNGRRRNIVVIASGVESSRVMPLGNVTRSVKVQNFLVNTSKKLVRLENFNGYP